MTPTKKRRIYLLPGHLAGKRWMRNLVYSTSRSPPPLSLIAKGIFSCSVWEKTLGLSGGGGGISDKRSVYAKGTGEELTGGGNRTKPRMKESRFPPFFALIVACPLLFPLPRSASSLCLFRQRRGKTMPRFHKEIQSCMAGSAVSP